MTFAPNNRKALALIALVFVLGVALGAVGHSIADRRVLGARTQQPAFLQPRPNPPRAVARLKGSTLSQNRPSGQYVPSLYPGNIYCERPGRLG